jgi:hypothetical protein
MQLGVHDNDAAEPADWTPADQYDNSDNAARVELYEKLTERRCSP